MDFGNHLDSLLRDQNCRFNNGAGLHFRDFRIGDLKTVAAMAQHRVELVQLFHAMQQLRQTLLEFADGTLTLTFPFRFGIDVGSRAKSTIRSSRFGRNSCRGGSRVRMITGNPSMAGMSSRILALHRQKFSRALRRDFFVAGPRSSPACVEMHPRRKTCAPCGIADAFGAVHARDLGIARDVGIGADAELARNSSAHQHGSPGEVAGFRIGQWLLPDPDRRWRWCRPWKIQSPCFTVMVWCQAMATVNWRAFFLNVDGACADDARPSHSTRDYSGVARFAADRGCESLWRRPCRGMSSGVVSLRTRRPDLPSSTASSAVKTAAADRGSGRCVDSIGEQRELLQRLLRRRRDAEVYLLLRRIAQHGLTLVDHAFNHRRRGQRRGPCACSLSVAGLVAMYR